ncbi:MAG: DUF4199 domain-containing protein [Pseudomonadota bacterium]|nr:DUF4199 domain-containing protein [Pseudomonadota bacterium]
MEAKNINYNEEWLKGGLILAGVSILLTMLTYVIDVSLMVEWWFGVVSLLISMGLLIYLGINYRNDIGGILSYGDAFKFSFLVFFVSYVVGIIFQIALYTVIDPELPEIMKQLTVEKTVEMMEGFGLSDEALDAAIIGVEDGIDEATTPMGMIKSAPLGIFFLLFFSAISAIFIKRNPPVSDRIN